LGSAQEHVNPVEVFEQVWTIFDTNYPYFDQRGIDWNAIHRIYRPQVTTETTDDELFQILSSMLGLLNDGHVNLEGGKQRFNAGITHGLGIDDYSGQLVRTKYLKGKFSAKQDSNFVYGWLTDGIAYLRIKGWKQKERVGAVVDSILADINAAKGIVIDLRANTGGNAFAAEAVANRFADRKRLFLKDHPKRGPGHDSLFPPRYVYVEPAGPLQFTRPVVVLQHRFSESATERFIMAARVLPHMTTIGDYTSGCFGTYYPHKLANGWTVSMGYSYNIDQTGQCWGGTGIPPELRILNTKEDIAAERDKVLEFAIDLINKGGHFGKEAPGSLNEMRSSLYRLFVDQAEKKGVETAAVECQRLLDSHPDSVYFSIQECMNGARTLFETGKLTELVAIFEMAKRAWPDAISVPWVLGMAYDKQGLPVEATKAYRMIAERKAFFPWDESAVADARRFLNKK
jgi:hypothetical protein